MPMLSLKGFRCGIFCVSFVILMFCVWPAFASVHLFIVALCSPAGKGLTSWLSFVMLNCVLSFVVSNCEFVTFPLVSLVRCGT